jgi:hypothetical protein
LYDKHTLISHPFYERDVFLESFLLSENLLKKNKFPAYLKAIIRDTLTGDYTYIEEY